MGWKIPSPRKRVIAGDSPSHSSRSSGSSASSDSARSPAVRKPPGEARGLKIDAVERAHLEQLVELAQTTIRAERAAGRDFPEVLSEQALLRFLRFHKHDAPTAAAAFEEAMRLRERLGAAELRQSLWSADARDFWRFERLPHASRVLPCWGEFLPTGTLDRDGDIVLVFSRALLHSWAQLVETVSPVEFLQFRLAREIQMQLLLHELTQAQGRLVRQTVIVDLDGIGVAELIWHATAPRVQSYRGTFDTHESFTIFPETGARLFVINAPLVVAPAFNVLKRLLPEATTAKYGFCSRNYRPTLAAAIDGASLPAQYGGRLAVPTVDELIARAADTGGHHEVTPATSAQHPHDDGAAASHGDVFYDAPTHPPVRTPPRSPARKGSPGPRVRSARVSFHVPSPLRPRAEA